MAPTGTVYCSNYHYQQFAFPLRAATLCVGMRCGGFYRGARRLANRKLNIGCETRRQSVAGRRIAVNFQRDARKEEERTGPRLVHAIVQRYIACARRVQRSGPVARL
ncbi:hypothetical protein B0G75_101401 [Paraburkholderia sp. BL18I3N2]|nr:hypothetical protein B0G75_101401 [Paraburkholderia sp. BL18I3N2]